MSVLTALSELTHCLRIGGGSVLTLPQLAELMTHLDSGACSDELLYVMAKVPRQPTPAEWDAMRAGESPSVQSVPTPEPEPEPEPVAETPTEEPVVETEEATEEEASDDTEGTPV